MEILVDSNILIYSLDSESSKYLTAQNFLRKNAPGLYIAHQNIFETLRVISHPNFHPAFSASEALTAVREICDYLTIVSPTPMTDKIALNLIEKYQINSNQIFDAYLTATMLSHDIRIIATDNEKDFEIFEEIQVFNPFEVSAAKMVHDKVEDKYG